MKTTLRSRMLFPILLGLAFSSLIFHDVVLFASFIVLIGVMFSEILWLFIVTRNPGRWYSSSQDPSAGSLTISGKTYPGDPVSSEFYFVKKGSGVASLESGMKFLKLSPSLITQNGAAKISSTFFSPYSGEFTTKKLELEITGPLNFFSDTCSIPVSMEYTVLPRILDIAITSYKLIGKSGIGEIPIERPGIGTEFYDTRPYQPSDDYRSINWKATARLDDTIIINERKREVGASYYLVLEASAPDYFDRDRLASAFLQIANTLTIMGVNFGVIVRDDKGGILALKKVGLPSQSLLFALDCALKFAEPDPKFLSILKEEISSVPSLKLLRNRELLKSGGYTLLAEIENSGRINLQSSVRSEEYSKKLIDLLTEFKEEERPSVIYVSGMFNGTAQVIELGTLLARIYRTEFSVANPESSWVVGRSEEEAYDRYMKFDKKLKTLSSANISYFVGDPETIVRSLF